MNTLTTLAFLCLILASCKKDSTPTGVQIQVSGLPSDVTLTLSATDDKEGTILDPTTATNGTYTTKPVLPGDRVTFTYILSKELKNDAVLKFYYKNLSMGATGFYLSAATEESVPNP